ncbi:glutamate formiminotransferase [Thermogymnomonas acidicola]|uniref:glutamate formimidoyltransferase n=1 Tax=Thermogymnomonas acidicola TaxID=399579 RepID=A0AA37BQ08_9ARCH|nr:glutamate formimidoyltransferase [Thermogymnomonas acidicola]GGM67936.1 glutamate formiminotransferase [Thermogymnomonas acidicola]
MKLVECVPNFSEGRVKARVDEIASSISSVEGVRILDIEMDENHNRSVITFVCPIDRAVEAAFRGIKKASELIDLDRHTGAHPRFGAADVVPFVPLSGVTMDECVALARELGKRVGEELQIPVFLYGEAAMREERRSLENIRSQGFQYEQLKTAIAEERWKPDFGPSSVGKAGATIIGARDFLIAYNVNLNTSNLNIGKKIAKALRARDGGLTFVKALSFYLEDKKMVQISMNLTNFNKTPIYRAFELVKLEASRYGVNVVESEIVGLVPLDALLESAKFYLQLNGFKNSQVLEKKLWG